jgi:uncharacterized protein
MINIGALALVSGLLIGCVGIGGVLLVPGLDLLGVDIHQAIAASMFSYIFSGVVGVWLYWRKGSIDWSSAGWLSGGAMPGGLLGALLAAHLGGTTLLALVGAAVLFTGARSLRGKSIGSEKSNDLSPTVLLLIGGGVGAGSALTGTGGPLLLVPLLMWLKLPVLRAVGLGQAIQIPIAGLASIGNVLVGSLDLRLGLLLGVCVAAGTAVGAHVAHAAPLRLLTRLVAILLVAVGLFLLFRSGSALLPMSFMGSMK